MTNAANAARIRECLNQADTDLLNATISLIAAVERADNDYAHNGNRLRDALGALRLVHSVIGTEHSVWRSYEQSRIRRESP